MTGQTTRVAILNVGTATVKSALAEVAQPGGAGGGSDAIRMGSRASREREDGEDLEEVLRGVLEPLRAAGADAVAHRVVHGGTRFGEPVRVDEDVENELDALASLAPLHNPPALAGIRLARRLLPGTPSVAVFDTAFHAARPLEARLYALPWELSHERSLFRFGFHGLAHASLAESLARERDEPADAVTAVTLQLGSGCSACAIESGRSVETSMGFTPLEGLPMTTRSGDLDPGVVLRLVREGRSADEVEALLQRESGLRGLAGSADVREVLRAEERGERRAVVAMALFVRRIAATVGAYLTLLGGRGSLVFGGGIGTGSAPLRGRVAAALSAWNVSLDPDRNASGVAGRISKPGSREVHVFETDEERLLARAAARVLTPASEASQEDPSA